MAKAYCRHGYALVEATRAHLELTGHWVCPHGCTEAVPMCEVCGHERHSPGYCVMSCNCSGPDSDRPRKHMEPGTQDVA